MDRNSIPLGTLIRVARPSVYAGDYIMTNGEHLIRVVNTIGVALCIDVWNPEMEILPARTVVFRTTVEPKGREWLYIWNSFQEGCAIGKLGGRLVISVWHSVISLETFEEMEVNPNNIVSLPRNTLVPVQTR